MPELCADGRQAMYINQYELDHYEPKPGKFLALREYDSTRFVYDKNHWGFTGLIIIPTNIDSAVSAGFQVANLIVELGGTSLAAEQSNIDLSIGKGITTFFIDEPLPNPSLGGHVDRRQMVRDVAAYVAQRGAKLIIGDWDTEYPDSSMGTTCGYHNYCRHASLRGLAMEPNPQLHLGANQSFEDHWYGTDDPRVGWTWLHDNCG